MQYLVTGTTRGIGKELVRQLNSRGDQVIAIARTECDLGDEASIAALGKRLAGTPIDVVINNAGVWGGEHQEIGDFDVEEAVRTYRVDALGPLLVSLALLPNLRLGRGKKLLHVTSGMGSIGDNNSGGSYAYRMAKAALNMMSRSLAMDLKADGIASAVINPGWVKTDMGGANASISVDESVRGILAALGKLDLATTGSFLNYKGNTYPW